MNLLNKINLYYDYKKIYDDNIEEYKRGVFEHKEFIILQYTLIKELEKLRKEIIELCNKEIDKNINYQKYLETVKTNFTNYKL